MEPSAARDPGRRQTLTGRPARRRAALGIAGLALAAGSGLTALAGCGGSDDDASVPDPRRTDVSATTDAIGGTGDTAVPNDTDPPADVQQGDVQQGGVQPGDVQPGDVQPEGFSIITAVITSADGEICEVCLWLADTPGERARGLMGVTDLGDAAGMAFRFDGPTTGAFYMFQTPTPLSIAWFADDGAWVGGEEMTPCLDTPAGECPLYSPGAPYVVAVEAFAGELEPLGVGPGSRIELLADSEADDCVLAGN